jgi:hypothetical protein
LLTATAVGPINITVKFGNAEVVQGDADEGVLGDKVVHIGSAQTVAQLVHLVDV